MANAGEAICRGWAWAVGEDSTMATVYIETSIVSHAAARLSSDVTVAALQIQARDWWLRERPKFDLVTSQLAVNEAASGDPGAAADRLKLLAGVPLVPIPMKSGKLRLY